MIHRSVFRLEILARAPPSEKVPADEDCLALAKKSARTIDEGPLFLLLIEGVKAKSRREEPTGSNSDVRYHGNLLTSLFDPEEPRVVTTIFQQESAKDGDGKKEVVVWRAATEDEARALFNFKDPMPDSDSSPSDTLSSLASLSSNASSDSVRTGSSRQVLVAATRSTSRERRPDSRQREAPKVLALPPDETDKSRSYKRSESPRRNISQKLASVWSPKRNPPPMVRPAGNSVFQPSPTGWAPWPPRIPLCFHHFGRPVMNPDFRNCRVTPAPVNQKHVPQESSHHNSRVSSSGNEHIPQRSMLRSGSLSSHESSGSDNESTTHAQDYSRHSRHRSKKVVTFNYMTKVQFM
ncbi:uncharacterized protein LOC135368826 [Ornithodoros turicata]|uniref:uncharacterized protein LOC135368826 n=1 Tax=Ornithodoros turicata TaxID=34597 RepID=UPI0031388ADE